MSGAVSKIAAERNQKAILELAMKPGNDSCADCKTRNPRWASHNLGIFICVNCASIHRKIGTHVSKVKSLTMDLWTKEQVENMRQAGNIKSNQQYNPDEVRNPPPTNMIDAERDSELEKFIRDKYEFKRFIGRVDRSAVVAAHLGPSRSAASVKSSASSSSFSNPLRSQTLPPAKPSLSSATSAPPSPARAPTLPPSVPASTAMSRSVSQPISPQVRLQPPQPPAGVWSDLASLQSSTGTSTLPLQYLSPSTSSSLLAPSSSLHSNFAAGPSMSANFTQGVSPGHGPASQGPGFGVGASPVSGLSVSTQSLHPSFASGATAINPFAQMVAQQQSQAQAQPNHFPTTSPFGSLPSQQTYFTPQGQVPQIQQPTFSQPGTNPFFNGSTQSQHMLSPQPQAQIMSTTPSPIPYTGSPFQQPTQSPFQQQPSFHPGVQAQFQPQPQQFGNVQPSSAAVAATGNPFTSWLTQQPNSYASAYAGQGSGQWGVM